MDVTREITREEAIANLKMISVAFVEPVTKEQRKLIDDTFDMAIKALEQEPCEDAISRQAVLASIKNLYPDMPIVDIFGARRKWLEKYAPYFECENAVEQLPSVNPQETKTGHWIVHEKPYGIRYLECPYCNIWYLNEHLIRNSYCPNCGARLVETQERSKE